MRLENERPSDNIEDQRGAGGGFGFPRGGGYRIDDHRQVGFHVGIGLDRNAPNYIFGLGYSLRIDGVLQRDRGAMHALEATPRVDLVTK